ncbi:hypothetical protein GCM10023335_39120 [Streptomyces siamensis]|uniref:Uncharacterized protein n=1 Tax=Streptomyces siamensis TaxID=1274986 RepID=A0ABP9J0T8_9ACTN
MRLVRLADDSLALIVPKLLGAADTLVEAGGGATNPFLRRSPCRTAGPASVLIRAERWRLSGDGLCPVEGDFLGRATRGQRGRKRSGSHLFRDVSHSALRINRCA